MSLCVYMLLLAFLASTTLPVASPALSRSALEQTSKMMKNSCKNKSGATAEIIAGMKTGDFPEDRKLMCYLGCCAGMMQAVKGNKLTVSAAKKQIKAMLPEELKPVALKQLEACKEVEGADNCELGYNLAKCCYETTPDGFIFPT